MTDSAIQSDVEKEVPQAISARNEALASIAERARKERDEEIKANGGEVVDTLNIEDKPEEKEDQVEEKAEPEELKEEIKEEPKPEVVKIKVDGEEREVPKEKILDAGIRALQKESTADKRLEEATRLLREVEQKYVQPQKEQKQEHPSQEWDDATIAYALEHGNEEQKAYAISLIRGRGNTTQDLAEIEERAVSKALDTVDFRESSQWFQTEYKDIVADPYLFQLAAMAEERARANGDTRTRKELYKSIGDDLRKWKGGITVSTSLEEKREQKSNIVNLPSASVKKTAPAEEKPKSTSDIIEEMRKKRGQR